MIALFLLQWWLLSHSTPGLFRPLCTVLPIHSPKPVSFSLIGMFYSLTDICAGASICPNTLFPLDQLENSLDLLLLHGMLVGGEQH